MDTKLYISRVAALFLLAMYLQLLAFQMITHRHLFEDEDSASTPEVAAEPQVEGNGSAVGGAAPVEPVEEEVRATPLLSQANCHGYVLSGARVWAGGG
jgi:Ca2+/H+ antiporter